LKTSFGESIQPFWLIFLSASPKVRTKQQLRRLPVGEKL